MISIAGPLLGDEEAAALLRVLTSGQLAQGEQVAIFEKRFAEVCQVREAVAVSSGTAALHLTLLAHEIGPGDEVITSPFSFAATANAILLVGATPVFVDIEPETYTIDPTLVEAAITRRTKAILTAVMRGCRWTTSIAGRTASITTPSVLSRMPKWTRCTTAAAFMCR